MINVILYSINHDFCTFIQSILGNQYNVVTKIDYLPVAAHSDFQINTISKYNFDYIIICEPKRIKNNSIKELLIKYGILPEKIIQPFALSWKERFFDSTYDDLLTTNQNFDGLIFGLSHSQRAIFPEHFDKKLFKLSLGGCDLVINLLWLNNLIKNKRYMIQNLKYVILDMPYYIFNWSIFDTSHFYYRIGYFEHFLSDIDKTTQVDTEYLHQYHLMKSMFFDKYKQGFQDFRLTETHIEDNKEASWVVKEPKHDIINKNIEYYKCFIENILTVNPNIKICNLVIPWEKDFMQYNYQYINNIKKIYNQILSNYQNHPNILTIDTNNNTDYLQPHMFLDNLHMNFVGAQHFSKHLNTMFRNLLY